MKNDLDKKQLDIAKECMLDEAKEVDEFVDDLLLVYDQAAERLKVEIRNIATRFAEDNELTPAQANKLLNSKEYKVWRKTIEEYLAEIEEDGQDSKIALELNTLSAKSRISRHEQLLSEIDMEMGKLATKTNKEIKKHLVTTLVNNYYRGFYTVQKTVGLGFNVSKINNSLVKRIIEYPWNTKTYSKTVWGNIDKLTETLRRELASGFVDGSSIQKMARRVDDVMKKEMFSATRLVRTETKYFTSQAHMLSYKKMGIDEYMYKGAGCFKCAACNGMKEKFENAIVGVNFPPLHPNCKCRIVPVTSMSLFDMKRDVNPLEDNVKFKEWKEKYIKDNKAK